MTLTVSGLTDQGPKRDRNEDKLLINEALGLFVVFDGMGGHDSGDVAANIAAQAVEKSVVAAALPALLGDPKACATAASVMQQALQSVSRAVWTEARARQSKSGMGSTAVALLVRGSTAIVAHVGDSRGYVVRGDKLYPLTRDHSVYEQLRDQGVDEATARNNVYSAMLTRGLGQQPSVDVDVMVMDAYPGDLYLLCSDGINKGVADADLERRSLSWQSSEVADVASELMKVAFLNGSDDNASIIALRTQADRPTATAMHGFDRAQEKQRVLAAQPLFHALSFQQTNQVASITTIMSVEDGVCPPGLPDNRFFVVISGALSMRLQGNEMLRVGTGESINETAIFSGQPTDIEGVAVGPTVLGVVSRDDLHRLCQREPSLGVELLWRFAHVLSQRMENFIVGTLTG
jgi:PPM family protein phosphatase